MNIKSILFLFTEREFSSPSSIFLLIILYVEAKTNKLILNVLIFLLVT